MSIKLDDHLYPRGRSALEPDLMPNVLDSDGEIVTFNDTTKRRTTESTVVNLGDSPNSNNGDPLRTAFAKINNFIEASYWNNESIVQKFADVDSELREGIFIYTDSDERYNISLLDNSQLHLNGTPNQIQIRANSVRSTNNPHDFDSEVYITVGLDHDVKIHNLEVYNHAMFDSDVYVMGNLWVQGTRTVLDAETVTVKDNFISMNWDGGAQQAINGTTGFVLNSINAENGIVEWDTATNTLTIGLTPSSGDSDTPVVTKSFSKQTNNSIRYFDADGTTPRKVETFAEDLLGGNTISYSSSLASTVNGTLLNTITGAVTEDFQDAYFGSFALDASYEYASALDIQVQGKYSEYVMDTYDVTVDGLATYTYNGGLNTAITGANDLSVTGDYTISADNIILDANSDITLDADGNDIIFRNGGATADATLTFADTGDMTWAVPFDFYLNATGDNIFLQGGNQNAQIKITLNDTWQALDATDDLLLNAGANFSTWIGDGVTSPILGVGTSALTTDAPFIINWNATDSKWELTGDGTGQIDGGTF